MTKELNQLIKELEEIGIILKKACSVSDEEIDEHFSGWVNRGSTMILL